VEKFILTGSQSPTLDLRPIGGVDSGVVRQRYWPNLGHGSKRLKNVSLLKQPVLCNSKIFSCILICIHRTFKILQMKNPQV
jgi:hypothetical protein